MITLYRDSSLPKTLPVWRRVIALRRLTGSSARKELQRVLGVMPRRFSFDDGLRPIVEFPIRLRDLRRAVARPEAWYTTPASHWSKQEVEAWRKQASILKRLSAIQRLAHSVASDLCDGVPADKALDRLISKHGANLTLEELAALYPLDRAVSNRTNHVIGEDAPISDGPHVDPQADMHGGDGNSGECDHPAVTINDESMNGGDTESKQLPDGASESVTGTDGLDQEATSDDASGADCRKASEKPTRQGVDGGDEPTGEMGTHCDGGSGKGDKGEPSQLVAPADGHDQPAVAGSCDDDGEDGADAGSRAAPTHGGGSGSGYRYDLPPHLSWVKLRAAIRRLVGLAASAQTPTPKYDAKALVRELASRRYAINRARKTEKTPTGVMIVTDHSGSCAHVSALLESAAAEMGKMPRVIVSPTGIRSQEGVVFAEDLYGDKSLIQAIRRAILQGEIGDVDGWSRIKSAGVSHLLVLGDCHGQESYSAARDAGLHVMWADPNGASMFPSDTNRMAYRIIDKVSPSAIATAILDVIEKVRRV